MNMTTIRVALKFSPIVRSELGSIATVQFRCIIIQGTGAFAVYLEHLHHCHPLILRMQFVESIYLQNRGGF